MGNRIKWIDVAKGLLTILVILGHTTPYSILGTIIYSFHMAAFFILSGFTFGNKDISFKQFIKKQFKGIVIPYIFLSIILLLYFFVKARFLHSGTFDLLSGISSIILPISGRNSTSVYGLWFLPCVLLSKIVLFGLFKIRQNWWRKLLCFFLFFAVFLVSTFVKTASGITILPLAVSFMIIGIYLKENEFKYKKQTVCIIAGVLYFAFFVFDKLSWIVGKKYD